MRLEPLSRSCVITNSCFMGDKTNPIIFETVIVFVYNPGGRAAAGRPISAELRVHVTGAAQSEREDQRRHRL